MSYSLIIYTDKCSREAVTFTPLPDLQINYPYHSHLKVGGVPGGGLLGLM